MVRRSPTGACQCSRVLASPRNPRSSRLGTSTSSSTWSSPASAMSSCSWQLPGQPPSHHKRSPWMVEMARPWAVWAWRLASYRTFWLAHPRGRCTRVASPSTTTASPAAVISPSQWRRSSRLVMKVPSGWQYPRAASGPSSRSRLSPTSVLEIPTARPARRYDSPSRMTAATASKRTSSDSGGVPPCPGGRAGCRWARRSASQARACAGSEERGQYDKGTRPPGRLENLAYGLVPVNVGTHRASRTPSLMPGRACVRGASRPTDDQPVRPREPGSHGVDSRRARAARGRPPGRRGRLRPARPALPSRAARPLLPDARFRHGCRGRGPGGPAARLAWAVRVRGQKLAPLLALQDRNQCLPEGDRAAAQAGAAGRLRPRRRSARRPRRTPPRIGVGGTLPGRQARARGGPCNSRGSLRAARGRRARLYRGAPASASTAARLLILRDVLGFSARETAEALETTPVSVDSALQRAHKTVDQRLPDQSQQATLRFLGDAGLRDVVDRYVAAWERGDVEAVVAMLADDARMTMPPLPTWYRGREGIAAFLSRWPFASVKRWRLIPAGANGQLAFAAYSWSEQAGAFTLHSLNALTLRGAQIEEITAFRSPEAFRHFGLPDQIQP